MHLNKLYFFLRNWNIWEKCGCSRKIQECGHADRHAAAHGRRAWASWRWVPCGATPDGVCDSARSWVCAAHLKVWKPWKYKKEFLIYLLLSFCCDQNDLLESLLGLAVLEGQSSWWWKGGSWWLEQQLRAQSLTGSRRWSTLWIAGGFKTTQNPVTYIVQQGHTS